MIAFIVGVFVGALLGFFACALLSAGKVEDLEREIRGLQNDADILLIREMVNLKNYKG